MSECAAIRSTLDANHIKYSYKAVTPFTSGRSGNRGNIGVKTELRYIYYLYVHKKDYDWAAQLIRERSVKEEVL